ncbi:hypothetical protein TWF694_009389 [Orbilia ellipsospora]|uniref:ubiquitinyl hydrolase 1 n=1 Tax=Orbilia ellipsospora TaxID=2528407 RepID=A0AAV9XBR0_9PEZI
MAQPRDQVSTLEFEAMFNHIVLPPQLPGKEDNDVDRISGGLLTLLSSVVREMRSLASTGYYREFSLLYQSLMNYKQISVNGIISKQILLQQFRTLEPREQLILHVTKQNAALLVHRVSSSSSDRVIFEAFEASPTSQAALEAESALQWDFPGIAVSIPYSTFSAVEFQEELGLFLEQASNESIKRFAATTAKAASGAWESRDTVDPNLITGLMMSLLEATGSRVFPIPLRKRIRDDICWSDGINPWRRNPNWLILRVAMQKHLQLLLGVDIGTIAYKFLKCWFLKSFLACVYQQIHPELSTLLKAKLCRRMAKLDIIRSNTSGPSKNFYEYFFGLISPGVESVIDLCDGEIMETWDQYRKKIERKISPLPKRAETPDTVLKLPSSGAYLDDILSDSRMNLRSLQNPVNFEKTAQVPKNGRKDFENFADRYYGLFADEENLSCFNNAYKHSADSPEEKCSRIARQLNKYLDKYVDGGKDLYQNVPEATSSILLGILELWVSIDSYAVIAFPMLAEYHPVFTADILNSLHIERARDFKRLQHIGEYLKQRTYSAHDKRSIFTDPCKGCFADRYVQSSTESTRFNELRDHIEAIAEADRLRKEAEWITKSAEYEKITQEILVLTCQSRFTDDFPPRQVHDDPNCKKCYLERKARRIRVTAHEHPLPTDGPTMRATLFEISTPLAFAIYRDITWRIISTLALPSLPASNQPRLIIQEYSQLSKFKKKSYAVVTLASTKKSFLQTHLAQVSLPTTLEKVCLPNGLFLSYYDTSKTLWPGRLTLSPTFYHHFPLPIPENSPFASLIKDLDPVHPPSSYDVIASQTKCPPGMNVHEFLSYQGLLSGYNRRLPSILIELASSNLNFSSEASTSLVKYLLHQAGPPFPGEPLRMVHRMFNDSNFSSQLLKQIESRLKLISSNWREVHCMEMLIVLLSRAIDIWALCGRGSIFLTKATELLEKVRTTISKWLLNLHKEIDNAETTDSCRRFSEFALWAALLGRSTYFANGQHASVLPFDAAGLEFFFRSSIILQHSLFTKPSLLPLNLRNALARDLRVVYSIRNFLSTAIANYPHALSLALEVAWPQEEDVRYLPPEILESPNLWWIRMGIAPTDARTAQTVLFHLLEGHLLLDGKPLGQLPSEHRNNTVLTTLFGNQNLLTVPSRLPGMTYMISRQCENYRVHLGFRKRILIVRAERKRSLLEYIPQNVFKNEKGIEDLPASLIDGCYHWLNLKRGTLHIRQVCWRDKPSDWTVDLNSKEAWRRKVLLVDKFSTLFKKVAAIFDRFEPERFLTVYQPQDRSLCVEMRRLDLHWQVNQQGHLQCMALQSFVDSNQDAGTWYGLRNMIVLRDIAGRSRSIITPLGKTRVRIDGPHVEVDINHGEAAYGRYHINTTLGRLDCPPEPWLLYTKALLHAYTSFIIPDPLTGKTGTEESLHCLRSGYCQPWTPLNPRHYEMLENLAKLTPQRDYYPEELKVMQKVAWDNRLRSHAQNEHFFFVVREIVVKSEQLKMFSRDAGDPVVFERQNLELYKRSNERRGLYERNSSNYTSKAPSDSVYHSRGEPATYSSRQNVFEVAYHLHNWSQNLPLPLDLATVMEGWQNIGGFENVLDKVLLSDKLSLDLPLYWGALVRICQGSDQTCRYKLMFLLALLSFNPLIHMDAVRTLIAFATNPEFKTCQLPLGSSFVNFRRNPSIKQDMLRLLIKPYCKTYSKSELQSMGGFTLNTKLRKRFEAAETTFNRCVEDECKNLIDHLIEQWPCLQPTISPAFDNELIDLAQILPIIQPEWSRLFFNLQLSNHISGVQRILNAFNLQASEPMLSRGARRDQRNENSQSHLKSQSSLYRLLKARGSSAWSLLLTAFLSSKRETIFSKSKAELIMTLNPPSHQAEISELEGIIDEISKANSIVRQRYAQDLRQSVAAYKRVSRTSVAQNKMIFPISIGAKIEESRDKVNMIYDEICEVLVKSEPHLKWLRKGNLFPCITKISLLEALRSKNNISFGTGMREGLVLLGLLITELQQLIRVEAFRLKHDGQRILDEENNMGHQNWDPTEVTDWLLLEIDSNLLIRPDQVEVAHATIRPSTGNNSLLQMNMGKGKTSCIMPMAAAVLADSKRLLRVLVPRALILQTVQMIQARLGGLVGREVRHVPFSRRTATSTETIRAFYEIHSKILGSAGLIVSLPEHNLSFMLSGLQRLSDGQLENAKPMVRIQSWLNRFSRDILDESDFTLAVRTQLIYPSGSQKAFDGHPQRWKTTEALLDLIQSYLPDIQARHPRSLEVVKRSGGGYPFIYFLRRDAEEDLIKRLVNDICAGRTPILPMTDFSDDVQHSVKQFISESRISETLCEDIRSLFRHQATMLKNIYHLRGLFVHRILLLALKKRWNVQYGLHPTRDPVAVPYHAKGVPSEQAEWGHPDVAILFTCLSFYYHGLSIEQLGQSLRFILQSDDPASEYERFTHSSDTLPGSLREWNAINVDDDVQLNEIWSHVRYNVVVIDHYLNNFVFPRHAKQFLTKLQASAWDLPLYSDSLSASSKYGKAITTGFSGTNDNKTMLPLTITQDDLPTLSHTNAEVLTYLLQPRNRTYVLAADREGRRWSENMLLEKLKHEKIRILIDAGAQILEMDNFQLVSMWMTIDTHSQAAIYFDETNKPFVLFRNGNKVPLLATPYAEDSTGCLIYLDESHTRGTDLKMPQNAKGALTIGLGQTKDHTVQAAMRLRQLGSTQSVVFFAPPEVHQSIVDIRQMDFGDKVDSRDVVIWLLHQTCVGIEQLQPLYFSQGMDFCRRIQAASDNPEFLEDPTHLKEYLNTLRQPEQQTLRQMYEPKQVPKSYTTIMKPSPGIAEFIDELKIRRRGFQDTGEAVHGSALQEVEQEREVAFEVESVREVQKPIHYTPYKFPGLHKDLITFVHTGRALIGTGGYELAFLAIRRTCSLGEKYKIDHNASSGQLYVSTEFTKTVHPYCGKLNDNFQRPVNWILISTVTNVAIIVTPEEAEYLIPHLKTQTRAESVHLLTYAAPITRKMIQFDSLKFFSIPDISTDWTPPQNLSVELGIVAGRLYFAFENSTAIRNYLDLENKCSEVEGPNGGSVFATRPLSFLQEWLTLKRKGQDFLHTPMGYLCQSKTLLKTHTFFRGNNTVEEAVVESQTEVAKGDNIQDDGGDDSEDSEDSGYEGGGFGNLY